MLPERSSSGGDGGGGPLRGRGQPLATLFRGLSCGADYASPLRAFNRGREPRFPQEEPVT